MNVPKELFPREAQVYEMVASGKVQGEIAEELGIGIRAVQSTCVRIRDRLGLRDSPVKGIIRHATETDMK